MSTTLPTTLSRLVLILELFLYFRIVLGPFKNLFSRKNLCRSRPCQLGGVGVIGALRCFDECLGNLLKIGPGFWLIFLKR